jgi:hypothetical protein
MAAAVTVIRVAVCCLPHRTAGPGDGHRLMIMVRVVLCAPIAGPPVRTRRVPAAIPGALLRARMGGCGQYATVKRAWMKDSFSRVSMTAAA